MERLVQHRPCHTPLQHHAGDCHQESAAKHKGKARVPITTGNIQEAGHARWIDHARQRKAETEDRTRNQRHGQTRICRLFHNNAPEMLATTMPVMRKVSVAAIERLENRAMPRMPWPDVQPDPMRVPIPTRSPATTITGQDMAIVTGGKEP